MAMRTERVRLGAIVFAPTRRRPWKLAREALTLDHLSSGRLVLPVGLGALDDRGFGSAGEATDTRVRAAILDETLAILDGLWSGEPFAFQGQHYRMGAMAFAPRPVQRPRIPIWVVGAWPRSRSVARALRWDGIIPQLSRAAEYRDVARHVAEHRPAALGRLPFEIVADGSTPPVRSRAAAIVGPFAEAGATWWIEADWSAVSVDALRRRIDSGPPAAP
jgi:alkanesulfonate monooxygenase SsuD/methylene tetrahydromethanopterin reductase-like flavin-dependent oxidoreductase (luciferase family)